MQDLFIEFLPPWVETNLQPAFYDAESGTILQQVSRMYAKINEIIKSVNDMEKVVKATVDYVDNYFKNLDVQDEIDNKLDEMVEDGTLEEIIGHYITTNYVTKDDYATTSTAGIVKIGNGIDVTADGTIKRDYSVLKFHSVKASSATYIVQLPNGKNLIVDSGYETQWTDIRSAIDSLGITKFDYAITTHFHPDHMGNNANLIETYDFSECTWWIGMKPDFTNHADRFYGEYNTETSYNNCLYVLTSNGITPVVPLNGSTVTLDSDAGITIQFFNTDESVADNYYDRIAETATTGKNGLNDWSLIARVAYGNQSILFTGDIEEPVEEQYAEYMQKATIMTAPHHGINYEGDRAFHTAVSPDVTICQFITDSATWLHPYYKEFNLIVENSKKVVTAYNSKSSTRLFTFELDGDELSSNVEDGGMTPITPNYILGSYIHIDTLIDTTKVLREEMTFKDLVLNLPEGAEASIPFWENYATKYAQINTDIRTFFPNLGSEFEIKIKKDSSYINIKIENMYNDMSYSINLLETTWNSYDVNYILTNYATGSGSIQATSESAFITLINKLPSGTYKMKYKDSDNTSLYDGTYEGLVTVVKETSKRTGFMTGHLRNTAVTSKTCIMGYFDTSADTQVSIHCFGN